MPDQIRKKISYFDPFALKKHSHDSNIKRTESENIYFKKEFTSEEPKNSLPTVTRNDEMKD